MPASEPRFCAHIFFAKNGVLESLVVKAPTLKEIEGLYLKKLVANTGRLTENFRIRSRMVAKLAGSRLPYPIWDITCAQTDGAWVKVHKVDMTCPPGWKT
jgi:hypothetical protein